MSEKKSFWTTLPGALTAIGGLIGTLAALITALQAIGVIGDGVRRINLNGETLSIEAPEWVQEPVRGSITFNETEEITRIGKVKAYLVVRTENSWKKNAKSKPIELVRLRSREKLCGIEKAANNGTNYYLGFQAHCKSVKPTCSYQWEGRRLWVTVGDVKVVLAAKYRNCPDRDEP
jgi:hypothetical protein